MFDIDFTARLRPRLISVTVLGARSSTDHGQHLGRDRFDRRLIRAEPKDDWRVTRPLQDFGESATIAREEFILLPPRMVPTQEPMAPLVHPLQEHRIRRLEHHHDVQGLQPSGQRAAPPSFEGFAVGQLGTELPQACQPVEGPMIEDGDGLLGGRRSLERLRPGLKTRDRPHLPAIQPPITTMVQGPNRQEHGEFAQQGPQVLGLLEVEACADCLIL
jgi:hypothetical protein